MADDIRRNIEELSAKLAAAIAAGEERERRDPGRGTLRERLARIEGMVIEQTAQIRAMREQLRGAQ